MHYGLDIAMDGIRLARPGADAATDSDITTVPPVAYPVATDLESVGLTLAEHSSIEHDGVTYALGEDAERVADATGTPLESLFVDGVPALEGYAEPALTSLVCGLLADAAPTPADSDPTLPSDTDPEPASDLGPKPTSEPDPKPTSDPAPEPRLCYTVPGWIADVTDGSARHEQVDGGALLADCNAVAADEFEPVPIAGGFAVVYDQLAEDKHTGLGIRIGEQLTSVALSYYGVPALSFSLPLGREWVVATAADETGLDPVAVADALESFTLDPDAAGGEVESALAGAFDALAVELASAITERIEESASQPGLAVPVVVAGSGAVGGVEYLIGGRFDGSELPISIRGARLADDPGDCAVRGALAAASDGVDGLEAVSWSESEKPADPGATLTFSESGLDESHAPPHGSIADDDLARADDAIDHLFDRLANRDEEIETVATAVETIGAEVDALAESLEATEERTAVEIDDLETRFESIGSRIDAFGSLESDLETTRAEVTSVERAVADLRDDHERLVEESATTADCEALGASITDLESGLEEADSRAECVSDRLEALSASTDERLEALDGVSARLAALEGIEDDVAAACETAETLEGETATLASRTDETARVIEETADSARVDRLETRIDQLAERSAALADRLENDCTRIDEVEATSDRIAVVADRVAAVEDRPDPADELRPALEDASEAASAARRNLDRLDDRCESLERALEGVETDRTRDREAIDDLRAELEAVRSETSDGAELAAPTLAGAGAAGVVAGGLAAVSAGDQLGFAVGLLGAVLLGVGVWLVRS